ncbi:sensor histidine kinase [Prescottella subtropica]|uniref:sensor histidine kinase n=1 Tax=Prescottella subtropica TaxID=2545757 RepID=UPI0010FA1A40|nr:sensor histidine kinase [Prescottella subtropica]
MSSSRLARRVLLETAAAALLPLLLVCLVLVPLLPITAVVVAELDRMRAAACGAQSHPLRPTSEPWWPWIRSRVRTSGLWRTDLPVLLVAVVLSVFSMLIAFFGFIGALVLVFSPVFWAFGIAAQAGPFTPASAGQSVAAVPFGFVSAVVTAALLTGISSLRDVTLLGFSTQRDRDLQSQLRDLRSSRASLTEAFELERRRIERDLHDGAQQDLVAVVLSLGMLEAAAESGADNERLRELASRSQAQAERALDRLRETVRGIHPRDLTDLGLVAAVRELVSRSPLSVGFAAGGDDSSLSAPIAGAVYFTISEALTNVVKHAGVDHVRVELRCTPDGVTARIVDEGGGGVELGEGRGTGLVGLRERMRSVGGDIRVVSPAGVGTTVVVTAPAEPPW